jgi:GR25 family glycosyltransferase involved in LPS biosynthesis
MPVNSDAKIKINNCFIIHLDRATERKKHVNFLRQMIPLKVSIVLAIDGKKTDAKMLNFYQPNIIRPKYPFKMRKAEIATFLSHRKCWQKIIDDELDGALIIEDDVSLSTSFFSFFMEMALQEINAGDFIRFPIGNYEKIKVPFGSKNNKAFFKPNIIGLGMQAQIVTKDAAHNLLNVTQVFDRPVDTYLQLSWIHQTEMFTVIPSGISEISNDLGGSLIGNKKSIFDISFREVMRPVYRVKIFFISFLNKR